MMRMLCLLAASLGLAASHSTSDGRLGWHGEIMPAGLVKAEAEGEYLWEKDRSLMVYVPPGTFPRGSDDGAPDERPVRDIHLDGFYIDKHEVSVSRWKMSGLAMPEPPSWGLLDDFPVVNVSWNDVQPYLEWSGKRLPSEAEWEKAARGTDGRPYPWGYEPISASRVVWKEHPVSRLSAGEVGIAPSGASPYGALNMAGNVYEWCQDWYDKGYYASSSDRNPVNDASARHRVLRGGSYVNVEKVMRSAYRYRLLPRDRTPYIGFRCVVSGVSE